MCRFIFAAGLAEEAGRDVTSVQSSEDNVDDGRHTLACTLHTFRVFDDVQMIRSPLEIVHEPGSFSV